MRKMNILQNILFFIIFSNLIFGAAMFLMYLQFCIEDKKTKKQLERAYNEYYGHDEEIHKNEG